MTKSIVTEEQIVVTKKLAIGEYINLRPNARIMSEEKSIMTRGNLVRIAFGYDTNGELGHIRHIELGDRNGCLFSESDLRNLAAEFTAIADYLKEQNASN